MKTLTAVLLTTLLSVSVSAETTAPDCDALKKEYKMVQLGMTTAEALCLVKKAKIVKQYLAQNAPHTGKPVTVYSYFSWVWMKASSFVVIDGIVVGSYKS
tara:strand:- start:631 stop:930 length:300 start_codon:yes stop_codon:yes gene_type:complete